MGLDQTFLLETLGIGSEPGNTGESPSSDVAVALLYSSVSKNWRVF